MAEDGIEPPTPLKRWDNISPLAAKEMGEILPFVMKKDYKFLWSENSDLNWELLAPKASRLPIDVFPDGCVGRDSNPRYTD